MGKLWIKRECILSTPIDYFKSTALLKEETKDFSWFLNIGNNDYLLYFETDECQGLLKVNTEIIRFALNNDSTESIYLKDLFNSYVEYLLDRNAEEARLKVLTDTVNRRMVSLFFHYFGIEFEKDSTILKIFNKTNKRKDLSAEAKITAFVIASEYEINEPEVLENFTELVMLYSTRVQNYNSLLDSVRDLISKQLNPITCFPILLESKTYKILDWLYRADYSKSFQDFRKRNSRLQNDFFVNFVVSPKYNIAEELTLFEFFNFEENKKLRFTFGLVKNFLFLTDRNPSLENLPKFKFLAMLHFTFTDKVDSKLLNKFLGVIEDLGPYDYNIFWHFHDAVGKSGDNIWFATVLNKENKSKKEVIIGSDSMNILSTLIKEFLRNDTKFGEKALTTFEKQSSLIEFFSIGNTEEDIKERIGTKGLKLTLIFYLLIKMEYRDAIDFIKALSKKNLVSFSKAFSLIDTLDPNQPISWQVSLEL